MQGKELIVQPGGTRTGEKKDVFVTLNLGTCVGLALLDLYRGVGGLLHFMLPFCPSLYCQENPAITANILRIANSACVFYCPRSEFFETGP